MHFLPLDRLSLLSFVWDLHACILALEGLSHHKAIFFITKTSFFYFLFATHWFRQLDSNNLKSLPERLFANSPELVKMYASLVYWLISLLPDRWLLCPTKAAVSNLSWSFTCFHDCRFLDNNNLTIVPQQLLDNQPELLDLFVAIYLKIHSVFDHYFSFQIVFTVQLDLPSDHKTLAGLSRTTR